MDVDAAHLRERVEGVAAGDVVAGGQRELVEREFAAGSQTAVFEQAATQVIVHLAHHEPRQAAGLLGSLQERRPVSGERPMEHGRFGTAAGVAEGRVWRVRRGRRR